MFVKPKNYMGIFFHIKLFFYKHFTETGVFIVAICSVVFGSCSANVSYCTFYIHLSLGLFYFVSFIQYCNDIWLVLNFNEKCWWNIASERKFNRSTCNYSCDRFWTMVFITCKSSKCNDVAYIIIFATPQINLFIYMLMIMKFLPAICNVAFRLTATPAVDFASHQYTPPSCSRLFCNTLNDTNWKQKKWLQLCAKNVHLINFR